MTTGAWLVLAAVVLSLAFGTYRVVTDGRFGRDAQAGKDDASPVEESTQGSEMGPTAWSRVAATTSDEPGERATLVQFSSAFCAPCRATRVVLADVAVKVPGVRHVEVDAEKHLELVRELDVRRTPTTLVLDASGQEVARASGAPRRAQVIAAIPHDRTSHLEE